MSTTRTPATASLRHRARRFAELVTTPLVPSDFWELLDPLHGGGGLRGRIVGQRQETRDAVSLAIPPVAAGRATPRASTCGSASRSTASASGARTR